MGLLSLFKKESNSYDLFIKKLNNSNTQKEIDEIVQNWNINETNYNEWINYISKNIESINISKLAFLLDSLYRENNNLKFKFFILILELTYLKINNQITPIENYNISKEKYTELVPLFSKIIERQDSDIVDILLLIMLKNDPYGNLLTEEQKQKMINGLNKQFDLIINYLIQTKMLPERTIYSITILLDYSSNIHNEETISKALQLEKMVGFNNNYITESFYKFKQNNNIEISNELKEIIIKNKLSSWLEHPAELGHKPYEIEITNSFKYDENITCTVLRYKKEENGIWLLGVVCDLSVFSDFKEYKKETEIEDAKKIVDFLVQCIKSRRN